MNAPPNESPRLRFGRRLRLAHARQFAAVFNNGVRRSAGPLTVIALPNEMGHCRLGLSIGRRFGGAVARNRLKRLLREAFRLSQHELPGAYDLVVVVARHERLAAEEYGRHLRRGVERAHRAWRDRLAGPSDEQSGHDAAAHD